jgi:hypothetical protein
MGPCYGPIGTTITIRTSRPITAPISKVAFYEITSGSSSAGLICSTCANVTVLLTGSHNLARGGTAAGSYYQFMAPAQLCVNGSGQRWAAFPIPAGAPASTARFGYGDIGTFIIVSCPETTTAPDTGTMPVLIWKNELGAPPGTVDFCKATKLILFLSFGGIPKDTKIVVHFVGPGIQPSLTFTANPDQVYTFYLPIQPPGTWTDDIVSIGGKPPPAGSLSSVSAFSGPCGQ